MLKRPQKAEKLFYIWNKDKEKGLHFCADLNFLY